LILCGIVLPGVLPPVHRAWMGLALMISRVTTPIILAIMYFGVITPIGLVRRMLGHDALKARRTGSGFWVSREAGRQTDMKHQF